MLHLSELGGARLARDGPRLWRAYSHPLIVLAGLAGAILIILVIDLLLPASWAVTLLDRGRSTYPLTVQNLTWLVFGLGLGELIVRARDAGAERAELREVSARGRDHVLPGTRAAPDLRRGAPGHQADAPSSGRFLPRLIHRVVTRIQTTRSVDQADAMLTRAWSCTCTRSTCATA